MVIIIRLNLKILNHEEPTKYVPDPRWQEYKNSTPRVHSLPERGVLIG
jgi:hypothetical protein